MSGTDKWATSQNFFDIANKRLGPFDIDLAAEAHNTKCTDYISPEQDSLAQDVVWINEAHTTCWLNPPFSNIAEWLKKTCEQIKFHPHAKIVVVCRIAPSTKKWWMKYVVKSDEILLIGGKRVQFEPPPGVTASSNPQECCLVVFKPTKRIEPYIHLWDWSKE